jgi:hypothetical protein
MSFTRIRSSGLWLPRTAVTPEEFEQLDANLANAVDGLDGGAYAPTAPIQFGGSGIEFAGLSGDDIRDAIPGISRGITKSWAAASIPGFNVSAGWALDAAGSWRSTTATPANILEMSLPELPVMGTLVAVRVWIKSGFGSGTPADLPTQLPTLKVWKRILKVVGNGFTTTQLGSTATDSSGTLDDYKTPHYIEVAGLSESLGVGETYSIELAPSNGDSGDSTDDLLFLTIEADLEE